MRQQTIQLIRRYFILTILYTNNLQKNDTMSYNGPLIVLCCLTRRVMFMSRRLVFVTCRVMFISRRLVFVTRRDMFMSRRLVFVTRRVMFMKRRLVFVTYRVQKCSYVKFSKSLIFV